MTVDASGCPTRTKRRSLRCGTPIALVLIGVMLKSIIDEFVLPKSDYAAFYTVVQQARFSSLEGAISSPSQPSGAQGRRPQQKFNSSSTTLLMENQIHRQEHFQQLIYQNQHPIDCRTRRILYNDDRSRVRDGFTLEVQMFARYLQAGMAMDRTFVFRDSFQSAYAPPGCQWRTINMTDITNSWNCLFEPPSDCTESMVNATTKNNQGDEVAPPEKVDADSKLMMAQGLLPAFHELNSEYFNSYYYGNTRIVNGIDFSKKSTRRWYADVLEHWDRVMGRFWIRAQMAHYLWRPSVGLQSEIELRTPKALVNGNDGGPKAFIGMHIRFTDNVKHFADYFGRNASVTRNLEHFMNIAREIRNETGISNIYLATDSTKILEELQNSTYSQEGWSFHIQNDVIRSGSHQLLWFKDSRGSMAAGIATDVEVLKQADYLIGSYQSNVFRLATELNTAYQVAKYSLDMNRHRTVDIEWYEDP